MTYEAPDIKQEFDPLINAGHIIAALSNELAAEKAINAALNNQIESIQSDNEEDTKELRKRLAVLEAIKIGDETIIAGLKTKTAQYESVNKMQAEAINRLNAMVDEMKANPVIQIDTTAQERAEILFKDNQELLKDNETLRMNLRNIRDTVLRNSGEV